MLIADDVRNTGQTFKSCERLIAEAGGTTIASVEIVDRIEAEITLQVPNITLVEYKAPANYPVNECPLCQGGVPITAF